MNDIINSPLNKPRGAVLDAKNMNFQQPLSIKIERTNVSANGSKTTYTISIEHTFTSASELKAV
jgi:hypothetical protein